MPLILFQGKFELKSFFSTHTKKVHVVWINVILRLYLCNQTIKAGDINSLNLFVIFVFVFTRSTCIRMKISLDVMPIHWCCYSATHAFSRLPLQHIAFNLDFLVVHFEH